MQANVQWRAVGKLSRWSGALSQQGVVAVTSVMYLPGGSNVVGVHSSQIHTAQRKTPDCLYTPLYYISHKKHPNIVLSNPRIHRDHHESNQYIVCVCVCRGGKQRNENTVSSYAWLTEHGNTKCGLWNVNQMR